MLQNSFLDRLEGFLSLPEQDRVWLDNFFSRPRVVAARTSLAEEGQHLSTLHVLLSGLGVRYKTSPDGGEQFLLFLVPGDFCDLHGALIQPMDHGIRTLTPSVVVDIPREAVLEAVSRRPELAKAFWWCSLLNEALLRQWLLNLGRKSAEQRIAHLFCELFARLESIGLAHRDGSFDLPVTQGDIGKTLGLSEGHVQRSLRFLKAEGLLSFRGTRAQIRDWDALRSLAGFDPRYLHLKPRSA